MLETIWFLLWGVLWAIYFILDGYDLGIGSLIPILGKSDRDRRVMLNAMGPFWDGNEVWLITGGTDEAVRWAAAALKPEDLEHRYAAVVSDGRISSLPVVSGAGK